MSFCRSSWGNGIAWVVLLKVGARCQYSSVLFWADFAAVVVLNTLVCTDCFWPLDKFVLKDSRYLCIHLQTHQSLCWKTESRDSQEENCKLVYFVIQSVSDASSLRIKVLGCLNFACADPDITSTPVSWLCSFAALRKSTVLILVHHFFCESDISFFSPGTAEKRLFF